ncbi:MAG: NAD(P)/FAD-dependent oxidoreductase [Bacteroidota bacterium]|nr:NAD(P)/FAD-dependent oxidoreductase [Bacteroidota bacterium]
MPTQTEIYISPQQATDVLYIREALAKATNSKLADITEYIIRKKSIDARKRDILIRIVADVYINETYIHENPFKLNPQPLQKGKETIIIGAGPAGLFAAIRLLELGIKPIIIERGKNVRERRRDLAKITRNNIINPESNYCFGEGGAGTYSDGKLYTRSGKRGSIERILNIFHLFGADANILYEAHPHIGTNKLPQIITALREYIQEHGGELRFDSKLTDIIIKNNAIESITINNTETIPAKSVILATGHSARDIFELLHQKNIYIEAKPFALGVRIEHPQHIIDSIQYHGQSAGEYLPPASYSLVDQQMGRGVFSFCMCPGGIIAPAATAVGEIVVNGWSPSKRNNFFANSGMVVSVGEEDFKPYEKEGALAALAYQKNVEKKAYIKGGSNLQAPAQRLVDFAEGRNSASLPDCSYLPGLYNTNLEEVLPQEIYIRIKAAMKNFGNKMRGYYTNEAVLVATESRTSSPVRIPRDKETLQHITIKGLFPCGEGAGYAGGIVSAAIDGERCAEAIGAQS